MYGWMCCNQWEKWQQWDDEDRRVAQESLRSQIDMLRSHASVFVWANGSDGRPPAEVLGWYHRILTDLHWQNAIVDTVSSLNRDSDGKALWDGIQMAGPYSWRPPSYWFSGRYSSGSRLVGRAGRQRAHPPFPSLKEVHPARQAVAHQRHVVFPRRVGAAELESHQCAARHQPAVRLFDGRRDVRQQGAAGALRNPRAQFEAFAANGWDNHKMTIYWMLNSHWPSFFGNLSTTTFARAGRITAPEGLRPLSVVFDSYATGNHRQAKVTVVNQTVDAKKDMRVRVRTYDLSDAAGRPFCR